jgi:hypothetical protein
MGIIYTYLVCHICLFGVGLVLIKSNVNIHFYLLHTFHMPAAVMYFFKLGDF